MQFIEITAFYFQVLNQLRREIREVEYEHILKSASPSLRREKGAVAGAHYIRKVESIIPSTKSTVTASPERLPKSDLTTASAHPYKGLGGSYCAEE